MRILFLSRRDAGRGPMAAGIARQMLGADVMVSSAGVEHGRLQAAAVQSMREIEVDIAGYAPKLLALDGLGAVTLVVVVCERDVAGGLPTGVRKLHWPLVDPAEPLAAEAVLLQRYRDTRVALSKHVMMLAKMKLG
jgi:arsenate reductase